MGLPMRHIKTKDARPTVVLADDHAGFLRNISQLLTPGYDVVATADNGMTALDVVLRLSPDVAVLDIEMPKLDGLGAAREMRQCSRKTKIVFLTLYDDDDYIAAALSTGALGYVLKSFTHSDLIPAIENALAGQVFVSSHSFSSVH
jgi:DNA-binding NarL/FixJ family response regulator